MKTVRKINGDLVEVSTFDANRASKKELQTQVKKLESALKESESLGKTLSKLGDGGALASRHFKDTTQVISDRLTFAKVKLRESR